MLDLEAVIKEFLTMLQAQFVAYLANNNRNATGQSSASIQVVNITPTTGQLVGSSAIQWVFTGRGPGGFPPLSKIIDWLNARGLPRAMAWAVAKKIATEGTKLYQQGGRTNNAFTQILTQDVIDKFSKSIADLMAVEIGSSITGALPRSMVVA